ncbi:hypothetical protein ACL02U_07455 [Streptomyces sp. MS06]|uniref:hypothetical protein n=1 Tax=Streptomyces sp. MS06 TaxID=3385974 RepID=UPI0039A2624E
MTSRRLGSTLPTAVVAVLAAMGATLLLARRRAGDPALNSTVTSCQSTPPARWSRLLGGQALGRLP